MSCDLGFWLQNQYTFFLVQIQMACSYGQQTIYKYKCPAAKTIVPYNIKGSFLTHKYVRSGYNFW